MALVSSFEYLRNPVYSVVDGVAIASRGPVYSVILAYLDAVEDLQEISSRSRLRHLSQSPPLFVRRTCLFRPGLFPPVI